ncbi:hypothetical protein NP233_g10747 [Leucocoprinus birnbaumii]|uniref:Uncharacterized protein n=1 Tax=Leucocoprinus birnbaumii TaxID=56174 RepID=A0AAD5VHU3_9AGAR|nr:hypothetical protein NP233_g10747 [Leucocoprinus birnbaumii]
MRYTDTHPAFFGIATVEAFENLEDCATRPTQPHGHSYSSRLAGSEGWLSSISQRFAELFVEDERRVGTMPLTHYPATSSNFMEILVNAAPCRSLQVVLISYPFINQTYQVSGHLSHTEIGIICSSKGRFGPFRDHSRPPATICNMVANGREMVAPWSRIGSSNLIRASRPNSKNVIYAKHSVAANSLSTPKRSGTMSQASQSPSKSHKRDRSNVDENGFNKDKRYRVNKKKSLEASMGSSQEALDQGLDEFSDGDPPAKSKMSEIEAQRAASDILRALKESRQPFAICRGIDVEEFPEAHRFAAIEEMVVAWLSKWGGLANWPDWLEMSYIKAAKKDQLDRWLEQVWDQADQGRRLETRLFQLYGTLPEQHYKVKELYRRSVDLVHLLAKAIALIEIRAPLIADRCALHQPAQSSLGNESD